MDNLFKNISRLGSEDISTEILRHLLSNNTYIQFQKLFYNHIINKFSSSIELKLYFNSQVTFHKKGRPDLIMINIL